MSKPRCRYAIYTRKSTEAGLEQDYNSLDAQRDAGEAYVRSQAHEGWVVIPTAFDDGGFSGGSMERPGLQALRAEIEAGAIDIIVVYKVDRLTRSLADFAKLVELFDRRSVSFVSVTQSFNTTTSMGRLTLNMQLSFAQFEREVSFGWRCQFTYSRRARTIGARERIRDKACPGLDPGSRRRSGRAFGWVARCRSGIRCRIGSWWSSTRKPSGFA